VRNKSADHVFLIENVFIRTYSPLKRIRSLSSKLESADLEVEDLSKEILACEENIYETFLGPKPDLEALQKLLLPDYL
jgi:hypothetical protein